MRPGLGSLRRPAGGSPSRAWASGTLPAVAALSAGALAAAFAAPFSVSSGGGGGGGPGGGSLNGRDIGGGGCS